MVQSGGVLHCLLESIPAVDGSERTCAMHGGSTQNLQPLLARGLSPPRVLRSEIGATVERQSGVHPMCC